MIEDFLIVSCDVMKGSRISYSSRYYQPLELLKNQLDADRLIGTHYNEDTQKHSTLYLYGSYVNKIKPIEASSKLIFSIKKFLTDNLYNIDEQKLLLEELIKYAEHFGIRTINGLNMRIELSNKFGKSNSHSPYLEEVKKSIDALKKTRTLLYSELESYYLSISKSKKPINDNLAFPEQLAVDTYESILEINFIYGKSLEKLPSLYEDKNEETLRDLFLLNLNHRHDNITTTGETFNKKGKTDILLKKDNGDNIFIAECKWWSGKNGLHSTINQLFDNYLSWRDINTVIIFFVKNKNLSTILSGVEKEVATHYYFRGFKSKKSETRFSFILCHPKDNKREINLEVSFFHFPK